MNQIQEIFTKKGRLYLKHTKQPPQQIVEPTYFSNWADLFFPKIANHILPLFTIIPGITPNRITVFSFLVYAFACFLLFISFPYHLVLAAILLPLAYILDCVDGQLARTQRTSSAVGDYLDKVLDVLKIYISTLSLAIAVYQQTHTIIPIFLGFTACFFFNFRYYIKLETMFSVVNKDPEYLQKSRLLRYQLYETLSEKYKHLSKTFLGTLKVLWYRHRIAFFVDEAEFVVITSLAALFNKLEWALWVLAVSQVVIATWRFFERMYQIKTFSGRLYWPMRK